MKRRLQVLLVNPPVYDVAAYGFWSAPLGLLYVGAVLRENGMDLALLDCLTEREEKRREDGRAPFVKQSVKSPDSFKGIRKRLKRYGMSRQDAEKGLCAMEPPGLLL